MRSAPGHRMLVHYVGILFANCTQFANSWELTEARELTLGAGHVIRGWDEGLRGLCVGDRRRLTVASDLAYGDAGKWVKAGWFEFDLGEESEGGVQVPGGATVQYDVQIMEVTPPGAEPEPAHRGRVSALQRVERAPEPAQREGRRKKKPRESNKGPYSDDELDEILSIAWADPPDAGTPWEPWKDEV